MLYTHGEQNQKLIHTGHAETEHEAGLTSRADTLRLVTGRDQMNFQNPFQLSDSIILLIIAQFH